MSKIDALLLFAFNHQTIISELIFAIILGIVVVWLFTHLRGEAGEVSQNGADLGDIQEALRKVLESTEFKGTTAAQAVQLIKDDDDDLPLPAGQAAGVKAQGATAASSGTAGGVAAS